MERVLPENVTQERLLATVRELNDDDAIDGILVQLPLPKHLEQKEVLLSVQPGKDVDGFHPYNMGALVRSGEEMRQVGIAKDRAVAAVGREIALMHSSCPAVLAVGPWCCCC